MCLALSDKLYDVVKSSWTERGKFYQIQSTKTKFGNKKSHKCWLENVLMLNNIGGRNKSVITLSKKNNNFAFNTYQCYGLLSKNFRLSNWSYMLRTAKSMRMLTRLRGSQEQKETTTMLMRRKRVLWLLLSPSPPVLLQRGSWDNSRYILEKEIRRDQER